MPTYPRPGPATCRHSTKRGSAVRIALFITCVNDSLYPRTGIAVTRILERLGHTVEFPAGSDVLRSDARQLRVRGYGRAAGRSLRDDVRRVRRHRRAERLVRRDGPRPVPAAATWRRHCRPRSRPSTYELSELLVDVLGVTDVGARFPHRVTYHPTCHGLRLLRLGDKPLRLLRAVRDIDLVELGGADECCGFGGTFALKNPDVSAAMLADKCDHIDVTGAELLVAADNSCLTHIGGGLSRRRRATPASCTTRRCWPMTDAPNPLVGAAPFPAAARVELGKPQLRRNLRHATHTIRDKRLRVVGELDDWEELRAAGAAIKAHVRQHLPELLVEFEAAADRGRRDRALGPRRRRGVPDRGQPGDRRRRHRAGQGQVDGDPGDRPQRVAGDRRRQRLRDRPGRADRAAGRRHPLAHPGAGDPLQPDRDPGHLPSSTWTTRRTA